MTMMLCGGDLRKEPAKHGEARVEQSSKAALFQDQGCLLAQFGVC
jgi:hypothetical protein